MNNEAMFQDKKLQPIFFPNQMIVENIGSIKYNCNLMINYIIMTEILESDSNVEASRVLQLLNEEDVPDLPPGSFLGAK